MKRILTTMCALTLLLAASVPALAAEPEQSASYDIICGTFFIAGLGQEDFVSLTDEQLQRYKSLYDNVQILPVRTATGEQGRIVGDQHIKKKGKSDHER